MPLWDAVELVRFRRLEGLELRELRPVNLLVGRNNSGKTSVLEAVSILANPLDIWTWIDTPRVREIKSARTPLAESLRYLFPQANNGETGWVPFVGHLEMAWTESGVRTPVKAHVQEVRTEPSEVGSETPMLFRDADGPRFVTLFVVEAGDEPPLGETFVEGVDFKPNTPPPPPRFRCGLITPVTHRTDREALAAVSRSVEAGGKPDLVRLLQSLDPAIGNLEVLDVSGRRSVIKLWRPNVGFVPLGCEGDGIRRALVLASAAFESKGGILLLDEIETALHTSALEKVLRVVLDFCRQLQVQVFATTHSLEALDAVIQALADRPDDLAIFQLPLPGSGHPVKRFSGSEAARMRGDYGFDLR